MVKDFPRSPFNISQKHLQLPLVFSIILQYLVPLIYMQITNKKICSESQLIFFLFFCHVLPSATFGKKNVAMFYIKANLCAKMQSPDLNNIENQ